MSAQTLKQIATIDLPGPAGQRFDYLTMDAGRASRITWQYGSKELTRIEPNHFRQAPEANPGALPDSELSKLFVFNET
jgi:hypothetical protein